MIIVSTVPEITFDDVLLLPGKSSFTIAEDQEKTNLRTRVSRRLYLDIPITSAPMMNVTETDMAVTLAKLGGMGFIHCYQSYHSQIDMVHRVGQLGLKVAASVDIAPRDILDHIEALWRAKVSLICLETANAHNHQTIRLVKSIKTKFPKIELCAAVIATPAAAGELIAAGVDSLRVGIGGGSHCTTRIITGIGRPQLSAVYECSKVAGKYGIPLISDGGIKNPGDIAKALVFGANAVTIGGLFAGTDEAPGKLIKQNGKLYKLSWGMCVEESFGKTYEQKNISGTSIFSIIKSKLKSGLHLNQPRQKLFAPLEEGSGGLTPHSGSATEMIDKFIKSLKRTLWYVGAKNLNELRQNAQVVLTSPNTVQENFPRLEVKYK